MRTRQLILLFSNLVFCSLIALMVVPRSWAAEFSFDYDVTYSVGENGTTDVTHAVTLTNNMTDIYAQNYTLSISSEKVESIRAYDGSGKIVPAVTQNSGQTIITLPFSTKVVGIAKNHPFVLSYQTRDIAKKNGQIWEILIPGIERKEEIRSYTVHVNVPASFGTPAYVSPSSKTTGVWTLEEHKGRGISLAYGIHQNFGFNLKYHLENTRTKAEIQEITIPPDTAYQQVLVSHVSPIPQNVTIDSDGNFLAQYELGAGEKKNILVEGTILVFAQPRPQSQTILSEQEKTSYTQPQIYWEYTDEMIAKAKELGSAKAIYEYVVETLQYDYSRVTPGIERLGAKAVFNQPQKAVCMEFSDLFVALARAAGIPAREIHGYAYTTNARLQPLSLASDVLHAWPQYYDSQRKLWISVDPTWGNTTRGVDYFDHLDFNHITFAILGQRSNYPYPAGAYRTDSSTKDVFVDFTSETIDIPPAVFSVKPIPPISVVSGATQKSSVRITNTGSILYAPKSFTIESEIAPEKSITQLPVIPPYGFTDIVIPITTRLGFRRQVYPVKVTVDGVVSKYNLTIEPFFAPWLPLILVVSITAAATFGILAVYVRRKS